MFFSRVFTALAASAAVAVSADTTLEYFVYAPAQCDSGMLARQQAATPAHLAHANSLNATGNLDYSGPILTLTSAGTNLTFAGSVFILKVEDLQAAKKVVTDDAYYTGNVDPKKIVVLPYLPYF